jgi:uncharacterized protein YdeI (BOF family)
MTDRTVLSAAMAAALGLGLAGAAPAQETPIPAEEGAWVSLTGEIAEVDRGTIVIDHGDGTVTVEMDDWQWDDDADRPDAPPLQAGETVSVRGRVDSTFYTDRRIEAASVYVEERDTYYFASPIDEEGDRLGMAAPPMGAEGDTTISVSGLVTEIDGREITLEVGEQSFTVDTSELGYNPLDDVGVQRIDVGERIQASGDLADAVFSERRLEADRITSYRLDFGRPT